MMCLLIKRHRRAIIERSLNTTVSKLLGCAREMVMYWTKRKLLMSWPVGLLLILPATTIANDYFEQSRTIAGAPQSLTERFNFALKKDDPYPYFELRIQMSRGRADLRILDPAGHTLEAFGSQDCNLGLQPITQATTAGTYTIEVTTSEAVGQWHLRLCGGPTPKVSIGPGLASAIGMMLVATASVWFWRRRTGVPWRWFWVGALIWTVAVAVKFGIAIPLNRPLLTVLESSLPYFGYLTVGAIYGGILTGITEVLFTFIAGLIWPRMADTAQRAVAIGVGAGAFEAGVLAVAAAAATLAAGVGTAAWLGVLVPVIERMIAILCHVASRALALMAVATHRCELFWYGFLLLSGVDAVAMYLHLSGQLNTMSFWTVEAMIAPFALVSIPITRWCIRHWPSEQQSLDRLTVAGEGSAI
jgi:hypothetical protein